ncbi:MAG: hypothetical protein ACE5IY_12950 [bacterium]
MKYWLHRISHHAETSYPLLEQEYLSIGFSDFSNTEFINKTRQEGWEFFEKSIQECWKSKPRTRHNLWRFIAEMKKGDRVLVPSWGEFSLFEIIDDLPVPIGNVDISNLKTWNVQAKFHDGETSDWATRQIIEYKNNKESMDVGYSKIAWVVSTADNFSQQCKYLAKEHHVALFNGDDFTTLLLEAGIGDLNNL